MEALQYPIGRYDREQPVDEIKVAGWAKDIAQLPANLRAAVKGLNDDQLDTPYRPGGWTVRQVVHHLADSHLNSYTRFKFALTEDTPMIKTYHEELWAELPEAKTAPIEVSLRILDALHERWHMMLELMTIEDYEATFRHPDFGVMQLQRALGMYAWHGKHHVAHIANLRNQMNW